jgi:hypothetical protein
MTAHPDHAAFKLQPKQLFARERSDWLDSFSQLEIAVLHCETILRAPAGPGGKPLSQRLTALKAVVPSPRCSNATLKELRKLVQECEALLPLRASIVHAVMQTGRLGDRDIALFQNSVDAARDFSTYLVMKQEDFVCSREALDRLTTGFEALATASSRPPPKRAEATGP